MVVRVREIAIDVVERLKGQGAQLEGQGAQPAAMPQRVEEVRQKADSVHRLSEAKQSDVENVLNYFNLSTRRGAFAHFKPRDWTPRPVDTATRGPRGAARWRGFRPVATRPRRPSAVSRRQTCWHRGCAL